MATVDELCRDIVGSLGLSESYLIAARWIDNRYKEMVNRVRFKHLREIGEVQIPATYDGSDDDATVDATRDSTAVTGTDTEWETTFPGSEGDQEYYYIKISSAWYKIASVTDDTNLVLATNFSEDDVDDGTHKIVKRHHALDSNARWLGEFVLTRLRLPLGKPIPLEQLDREAPGRILTDQFPRCVAQVGVDSNGYLMVEFYPYSAKSEIVHYVFWNIPTALTVSSTIPSVIDPYQLKEGVLIDAYRYLKSKAYQSGAVDIGNSYRNDEFAQATKWERYIMQAVRSDQGADDKTFILQMYSERLRAGVMRTAHDYVYQNWSYPS